MELGLCYDMVLIQHEYASNLGWELSVKIVLQCGTGIVLQYNIRIVLQYGTGIVLRYGTDTAWICK